MWIESVLTRKLDRVAAPEDLWARIDSRIDNRSLTVAARTDRTLEKLGWTLVAAMLVVVLAWGFRPRRDLVMQSESAMQIREWVRANAGFDVPLHPGPVRLTGARLMRGDVAISCRVGNREAKLVISKGKSSLQHGAQPITNRSALAWGMSDRLYTLACATPEDLKIACLLCHSSSESRIALN